jgi:hypothetical protein
MLNIYKWGLKIALLTSVSILSGCVSTTKDGTLGSKRKQFLILPATEYQA